MSRQAGGRVIFIGNIPYGLTEEQIIEVFSSAGQVKSFRLVYNKDNHQPKGYGFLEYVDADSAASAKRNLDQHEIMNRKLRVDFTNESGASEGAINNTIHSSGAPATGVVADGAAAAVAAAPGALPPLPSGQELPQGVTCADAISQTLSAVPAPQLLDILSSMRGMAASEPQKATALLSSAPQLSYAMFQALLLLGLVDTNVLQGAIGQAAQQAPPPQQHHVPPPPPMAAPQQHMPPYGNPAVAAPPGQYGGMAPPYGASPAPPPHMSMMSPPPQNPYAQRGPLRFNFPPEMAAETRSTVEKIFSISDAEIGALDANTRAQIDQARATYRHLIV